MRLLIGLPFFFIACSSGQQGASDLGKEVYKGHCVSCHGDLGDAQVSGAKDLTTSLLAEDEVQSMVLNGRMLMRPYKGVLSLEEIEAVSTYVFALRTQ